MTLDSQHLTNILVSAGVVAVIMYRRFRRNVGKQRLRRGWMTFRMGLLAIAGLFLLGLSLANPLVELASAAGLAIGVGLGIWGASRTRFLKENDKLYYIPHTYTGLAVTALFLGRVIYKYMARLPLMMAAANGQRPPTEDINSYVAYVHNPLTRVIFFTLVGYYVYYYFRVLWESKHLKPEDWEQPGSPASKSPA